jgi:hypothetical protein
MTDVHDLLERDGRQWRDGFRPPDLEVMLGEATRPGRSRARWVWPVVAAVLLLTVPLITLLLRSNPRHDQPAVTPPPGAKPLGSVPWMGVAVSQGADGRSVSVWVDIDKTKWCVDSAFPVYQASTVEKPTRVTIEVRAYEPVGYQPPSVPPGAVLACAAVGHFPVPILVHLSAPLGRRSLVDAATGQSHPVRQAADMPSLTKLPAGYVDAGSSPAPNELGSDDGLQFGLLRFGATHTYRNGGNLLTLERYQGKPLAPVQPVQATGTVLGHPAQIGGRYNSTAYRCAGWSAGGYTWQLCSGGIGPHTLLGVTELLAVANSIR